MNAKKQQSNKNHQSVSFETMVSKAALAQLKPDIAQMVNQMGNRVGSAISQQIADTMGELASRIIVLEKILIEKFGYTPDDLVNKVADLEDEAAGFAQQTLVEKGDVVRIEIKTKTEEDQEYAGSSKAKLENVGSGHTLGDELETAMVGMTVGETKVVKFGEGMVAEIKMCRCARKLKKESVDEQRNSEK